MDDVSIVEREVTKDELALMSAGFREHQLFHGSTIQPQSRYTFTALANGEFVGCISGLRDNNWFYLSDLWLKAAYRQHGLGKKLLTLWEQRVAREGVKNVYTWTAEYEAPDFYKKHGWIVFVELKMYFSTGHSRIGLLKALG